ncbi:MAG: DNA polymerase I [Caldimicrobium sp.]|nr:DNA polymerase I [Caldimicrobium sp.]MDW8183602.1 DNA polymerase I [Caldimicrobium sp.]
MGKEKDSIYSGQAVLIDGSSFIYRAYYAIPGYLATTKGLPTKAIFGVTQMLLKILREWKPEILVWFMDEKAPTFRHIKYEDYKATRPPMPEDLKIQIPYIKKIVSALGISLVSAEGFEADDLMATFIKKFSLPIIMIAPDKDLLSLIDDRVSAYDPIRETLVDLNGFLEKYGFNPSVFPHFRSIAGDLSDNIKGVPGVGEKIAKELITKYSTLTNLYDHLDQIKSPKIRENLLRHKDRVFQNLELMRLREDSPLPSLDLDFYRLKTPDYRELKRLFKELEFRKFLREFPFPEDHPQITVKELTPIELCKILELHPKDPLALHFQESIPKSLFEKTAIRCYLAFDQETCYTAQIGAELVDLLKGREVFICDYKRFIKAFERDLKQPFDVKLASYLLNPGFKNYELETLISEHLDLTFNKDSIKTTTLQDHKIQSIKVYGLLKLGEDLKRRTNEEGLSKWLESVEIPLSKVLYHMEKQGMLIDLEYVKDLNGQFISRIKEIEDKLYNLAGTVFNPRSSQEVAQLLFEKLRLPRIKKTPKGDLPSTDAEVLEELSEHHPIVPLLLQYRTLYKLKSTYVDVFLKEVNPKTGRLHTEFNQTGTATGRLSSQKPNLQNIPVKGEEGVAIRRAFIAGEGSLLVSLDYSQIELRILAHFSEDDNLKRAFELGEDIHSYTACEVFGTTPDKVTPEMRRIAKVINFGIAYGMSPYGLSRELKIDVASADAYIRRYFSRYPKVKDFIENTINFARENGYVTTLVGRKRYLPEIFSSNKNIRELGQRMAINTPIQGSAADLIKAAMVVLFENLEKKAFESKIVLQVHDELLLEVPEKELDEIINMTRQIMEDPFSHFGLEFKLRIPLKVNVSYGKSWADCK